MCPRDDEPSDARGGRAAGSVAEALRLAPQALRWRVDPARLPFATTEEVPPLTTIVGQDAAVEALHFGLEVDAPGQNIFVSGLPGTGRVSLLRQLLEDIRPACPLAPDRCYVHNFEHRDRPRLLSLPRGTGRRFARAMDELVEFIRNDLGPALSSEAVQSRRKAIEAEAAARVDAIGAPFDAELRAAGLTLVTAQVGQIVQPQIVPVLDGEVVSPVDVERQRAAGQLSDEQIADIQARISEFSEKLGSVGERISEVRREAVGQVRELLTGEARTLLGRATAELRREHADPDVGRFVDEVIDDVVRRMSEGGDEEGGPEFLRRYRVNVVQGHREDEACPIVVENVPTVRSLLGCIDVETGPNDKPEAGHMTIRAGSLLRADGGYLILEAKDLLSEPGAWRALVRVLRAARLDIVPPETEGFVFAPTLKPESIPVNVKVVLLGDPGLYAFLDMADMDFSNLFKVLASFETETPRDGDVAGLYAGVLSRLARDEHLPPFDASAVAELLEHGARIAARQGKVTLRFGRLADIAREAVFVARKDYATPVTGEHVREAVRRTKKRADLPSRLFRELVAEGTLRLQVSGGAVGQVNGLATSQAGPLTYGFPARITATIGAGTAGAIDIEAASDMSGRIHTKGFHILGGLLRHLLPTEHPLTFSASLAFEQSYGGIDGDSASGAEVCCLLSALTGVPLRQDLAMTGAIDQHGHVQPIGAVNEKIEGFFDVCSDGGLTGTQGVIVPRANAGDLMLRHDVVAACAEGRFAVYAVETIQEALELFTGRTAGELDAEGRYAAGTLLHLAVERARRFWRQVRRGPLGTPAPDEGADDRDG